MTAAVNVNAVARRAAATTVRVLAAAYRDALYNLDHAVLQVREYPALEFLRPVAENAHDEAVAVWEALVLAASDLPAEDRAAALECPHPTAYPFLHLSEIPEVPELELADREDARLVDVRIETDPAAVRAYGVALRAAAADAAVADDDDDEEVVHDDHSDRRVCQGLGCVYGDH